MNKKVGRNDPCPCGSGKKYKNCHMLIDHESSSAKYTAAGKRKIKAKVINLKDKSLSIFGRSATIPQAPERTDTLEKLKFRMTKSDFRNKEKIEEALPFAIPTSESITETPKEKKLNLPKPGEEFKPTIQDLRKKKE